VQRSGQCLTEGVYYAGIYPEGLMKTMEIAVRFEPETLGHETGVLNRNVW
jgi:hypothetical protein